MRAYTFKPICVAFAAMLFTAASAAQAQLYRWVDQAGTVTYSDHPPDGARDVTLIDDSTNVISSSVRRTLEILNSEAKSEVAAPLEPSNDLVNAAPLGAGDAQPQGITPMTPEAVRDPCLRSPDPRCYERNRANYIPGRGYTPPGAIAAIGSTAAGSAGGTLSGGTPPPPPKLVAPKASMYALPPGSDLSAAPVPTASTSRR